MLLIDVIELPLKYFIFVFEISLHKSYYIYLFLIMENLKN